MTRKKSDDVQKDRTAIDVIDSCTTTNEHAITTAMTAVQLVLRRTTAIVDPRLGRGVDAVIIAVEARRRRRRLVASSIPITKQRARNPYTLEMADTAST